MKRYAASQQQYAEYRILTAAQFWWSNVPQSEINTFPKYGQLLGYSPFREVQLFIDGMLAGVAWPFPIIFTGGVVPGLWRPIVGIDAFDLKEDEIDITSWLPLLCDGSPHNFTIRVSGLLDHGDGMYHHTCPPSHFGRQRCVLIFALQVPQRSQRRPTAIGG